MRFINNYNVKWLRKISRETFENAICLKDCR